MCYHPNFKKNGVKCKLTWKKAGKILLSEKSVSKQYEQADTNIYMCKVID